MSLSAHLHLLPIEGLEVFPDPTASHVLLTSSETDHVLIHITINDATSKRMLKQDSHAVSELVKLVLKHFHLAPALSQFLNIYRIAQVN